MNGIRLSVCVPGATSAELVGLGRWADRWNLAGIWAGDPRGAAPNAHDSYVTAAAAAIAAVTADVRIGVFLGLAPGAGLVRIAEDAAVVDQASGGRLELGLREGGDGWTDDAARFLRAWNDWPLPGLDETVAVLPGPAQPVLPRVVVGGEPAAETLLAGRVLLEDEPPPVRLLPRRRLLVVEPDLSGGVIDWLAGGTVERVLALREQATAAGAHELLLVAAPTLTEEDVRALGTVVVPALRASARDVAAIAGDAWVWLTRKQVLHAPPPPR